VTAKLQTASVAYFQRKIQLSGFPAYPKVYDLCLISKYLLQKSFQKHNCNIILSPTAFIYITIHTMTQLRNLYHKV